MNLPDLTGRTFLVTGATSGLGRAAALRLAGAGATVLAQGRSPAKTAELARAGGMEPLVADFARLDDVRRLAGLVLERTGRLDAILHNAGTYLRRRTLTEDGHESTFQVNYLAPFLLQLLLQELMLATPNSRIVVTTSVASRIGRIDLDDLDRSQGRYRGFSAYAATKLESVLWVRELRRRLVHTGVMATAVHPGAVATNFGAGALLPRFLYRIPIKNWLLVGCFVYTAEEGAEPIVWLATDPDRDGDRALYYDRYVPGRLPSLADDPDLAQGLWERSEAMVQRWLV